MYNWGERERAPTRELNVPPVCLYIYIYIYIYISYVSFWVLALLPVQHMLHGHASIINPRRACAARVTVVDCLFVCLCTFYSRTTGYETAYERYQQLQCYKRKKINVAILLKPLRSGDMA